MVNELTKKIVIIGVGNCGSQVANLAAKKYDELFDCICINTSESDLAMVNDNMLKFKIGEEGVVEGSGKNRDVMKGYLRKSIKDIITDDRFQEKILDKKYGFVITSAAGGTGSGASPTLVEILRQMFPDTYFILVAVLPQVGASLMEQGNTKEFVDELYKGLGPETTYMIYDNESTASLPPTVALTTVNEQIVEDLRILTGVDNFPTPYESIDPADMDSIITTPGRLLIARLNTGLTEKNLEDTVLDDMIIKAIKKSAAAETDRNQVIAKWGIITYFTENVNKLYHAELSKLCEFIGTPREKFNHNAVNDTGDETLNFIYVVASGLSPINDRVKTIMKKIEDLSNAMANGAAYVEGESASYAALMEKRKQERRDAAPQKVSLNSIFDKFSSID